MIFTEPPVVLSPSPYHEGMDELLFYSDAEHGPHRVSMLVPPKQTRTADDDIRAHTCAERAIGRALAHYPCSYSLSLGW